MSTILMPDTVLEEDDVSLGSGELSLKTIAEEIGSMTGPSWGSDSGRSSAKDDHSPEALVRKENQAVRVTRLILILILIGATAATGYFVYEFTRESQEASFDDAFTNVALKLTDSMISDTSLKVR